MKTTKKAAKHPLQPLEQQDKIRFKRNAIVCHLIDVATAAGLCDMNMLAVRPFSVEDREQFAQLIGYSLDGFSELSYVTDETYEAARSQKVHVK